MLIWDDVYFSITLFACRKYILGPLTIKHLIFITKLEIGAMRKKTTPFLHNLQYLFLPCYNALFFAMLQCSVFLSPCDNALFFAAMLQCPVFCRHVTMPCFLPRYNTLFFCRHVTMPCFFPNYRSIISPSVFLSQDNYRPTLPSADSCVVLVRNKSFEKLDF